MVSGGMTCVKYLLFCFNLLFAISGIAILTVGAIIQIVYSHYRVFVDDSFHSTPVALMIIGGAIFVIAFFGCCGAVKEYHCMVVTFSVLLFVLLAAEIVGGVVGYVKKDDMKAMLQSKLNSTMHDYTKNEEIKDAWHIAQHELKCCGMSGPEDWNKIIKNGSLPHTCCPDTKDDGTCTLKTKSVYKDSCFKNLEVSLSKYGYVIGGIGLGVALSQILGIIFACSLARSIRKEYETV